MRISFVILHYKTSEDTIECIDSINSLDPSEGDVIDIVVVDNASANGSIEEVEKKFGKQQNIHILKNKENLGFARGNNTGYEYAKGKLSADYIMVLNNDIIVKSKDIVCQIKKIYEAEHYHIMGPDIISMVDNGHQNPAFTNTANRNKVLYEALRYRMLYIISKIGLYDILKKNKKENKSSTSYAYVPENRVNCQLHGSFLIFSPDYVKNESYAFYPKTFLYREEAILYQHCMHKGYKTFYCPKVEVLHKEDSSTSFMNNSSKAKREFVFDNLVKSNFVYRKFLKNKDSWK